jgi:RHS repeat-associated protein
MTAYVDIKTLSALGCSEVKLRCVSDECFPGQYFDNESGLHYNYFRDYDPEIGRYITSDPIGLNGGVNSFAYANSNSIKLIDALGLASSRGDSGAFPATTNCSCVENCMKSDSIVPSPCIALRLSPRNPLGLICQELLKAVECTSRCAKFCEGEEPVSPFPKPIELTPQAIKPVVVRIPEPPRAICES